MDRVCGLDVHKDSIFMCILTETGEKTEAVLILPLPLARWRGVRKAGWLSKRIKTLCERLVQNPHATLLRASSALAKHDDLCACRTSIR